MIHNPPTIWGRNPRAFIVTKFRRGHWLVVEPCPSEKYEKSVGMMTFSIYGNIKKCSKPPTRWNPQSFSILQLPMFGCTSKQHDLTLWSLGVFVQIVRCSAVFPKPFRAVVSKMFPQMFPVSQAPSVPMQWCAFGRPAVMGRFPFVMGSTQPTLGLFNRIYRNVVFQCLPTSLLAGSIWIWGVIGSPEVTLC